MKKMSISRREKRKNLRLTRTKDISVYELKNIFPSGENMVYNRNITSYFKEQDNAT